MFILQAFPLRFLDPAVVLFFCASFLPHYAFPNFPFLRAVLQYSLLFRPFLHRSIIRHFPTGCASAFNLLYSFHVSRQSCITSVVPSSLPHAGARTPFFFPGSMLFSLLSKAGVPVSIRWQRFVFLPTFQTVSRECFHSFFF